MTEPIELPMIDISILAKAKPSEIWQALTDEDDLENWWGEGVTLEPIKNGNFREPWEDDERNPQMASGKVRSLEINKQITFTWKEKSWPKEANTECQITIEEQGKMCLIHLTHKGWESLPEEIRKSTMKDFKIGWNYHLKELKAYLEE
ncbi:MAG: SRPBCC domain-containing protein [Pseudobdellovibrio sp.]